MANVQKKSRGEVIPAEDLVRENVRTAISQYPALISYDATDPANEMLMLRCAVEQGIPAASKDGWRAVVSQWWTGTSQVPDEESGEMVTLPCLVLISTDGELCRLYGWPVINSWARLLRAASLERCLRGIAVRVKRVPTATAGRSCWNVLPDA